jgi:hypothetical protein
MSGKPLPNHIDQLERELGEALDAGDKPRADALKQHRRTLRDAEDDSRLRADARVRRQKREADEVELGHRNAALKAAESAGDLLQPLKTAVESFLMYIRAREALRAGYAQMLTDAGPLIADDPHISGFIVGLDDKLNEIATFHGLRGGLKEREEPDPIPGAEAMFETIKRLARRRHAEYVAAHNKKWNVG